MSCKFVCFVARTARKLQARAVFLRRSPSCIGVRRWVPPKNALQWLAQDTVNCNTIVFQNTALTTLCTTMLYWIALRNTEKAPGYHSSEQSLLSQALQRLGSCGQSANLATMYWHLGQMNARKAQLARCFRIFVSQSAKASAGSSMQHRVPEAHIKARHKARVDFEEIIS